MKRFLVCFAVLAIWFAGQNDAAAQSGSRADSYQNILSQVDVPNYDQIGGFGQVNYRGGYGVQDPAEAPTAPPNMDSVLKPADKQNAPVPDSSAGAAPMSVDGGCNPGCGSQGSIYDGYSYDGNVCAPAGCAGVDPVYTPGRNFRKGGGAGCGAGGASCDSGSSRNLVFGWYGLIFDRDYEDDVFLTRNPAGDSLLSTDADAGTLGGTEFFIGSRNEAGNGLELRYWGLFANDSSATLAGASFATYVTGLQDLTWPLTGDTVYDVYNRGTLNTVTRDNEFHNVEANFLRRGGCFTTRTGRCATYELMSGFRWFEFDEEFRWDVTGPTPPTSLSLNSDVDNTLLGFQLGGRSEVCLSQKLRMNVGTKFGIFNNRVRVAQQATDGAGTYAQFGGVDYNFRDSKNDFSLLGELDISTAFHFNACTRLVVGYRLIGVSGIALAPDQFNNFNYEPAVRSIQSNNDLILGGTFFGFEVCR